MSTLTSNLGLIKPASTDLVTPVGNAPSDLNTNADTIDTWLGRVGDFSPTDSGYLGWTQPNEYSNNTFTPTTQLYYVAAIPVPRTATCTGIACYITTTPSATNSAHQQFAVFDATGTRIRTTTDNTSAGGVLASTFNKIPWSSTFTTAPQMYYVMVWLVTTQATKPTFTAATNSGSTQSFQAPVENNGTTIRRWGSFSTGSSTAIAASITVSSGVVTIGGQTAAGLTQPPFLGLY